jgi:type IV pilus assembly protein PilC
MPAANPAEVRLSLYRQGIRASRVSQASAPVRNHDAGRKIPMLSPRIKPHDMLLLTQQTANMLKAGLPLLQALNIVAASTEHPRVRQLLSALQEKIAAGGRLSEALSEHPHNFNRLFISLTAVGEQSGTLDTALERLAGFQERDAALVSKVKKAMTYPLAVLATAILVTAVLLVKVVPQFAHTFADLGAPLPVFTQRVLQLSDLVITHGWLWAATLAGVALCCCRLVQRKTGARMLYDRLLLRIPVLGALVRNAALARICRTLATTTAAGLSIVDALKLSATAAGNLLYQQTCLDILSDVEQGQSLGFSIRKTGVFPVMITQLTNAGEESGTLDAMLEKCAGHYEQRVNDLLDGLTGLLEPLIMVVLGALVGGLMVAMYLPIFRLGAAL